LPQNGIDGLSLFFLTRSVTEKKSLLKGSNFMLYQPLQCQSGEFFMVL